MGQNTGVTILGKQNLITVGTAIIILMTAIHTTVMFTKIQASMDEMHQKRWTVDDMERYNNAAMAINPNFKLPDPHEVVKKRKQYE